MFHTGSDSVTKRALLSRSVSRQVRSPYRGAPGNEGQAQRRQVAPLRSHSELSSGSQWGLIPHMDTHTWRFGPYANILSLFFFFLVLQIYFQRAKTLKTI